MFKIVKEYPPRGPLQLFRLEVASAFTCFRCGVGKKAKLRTVFRGNPNRLLCNGCYGRLLSMYEVKSGTADDDDKVTGLAELLLGLATLEDARRAVDQMHIATNSSRFLTPLSLRFLGTSEHVATKLYGVSDLDWSAAIIGLCKAVEVEVVTRIIDPLKKATNGQDLSGDVRDKDLGRVAAYCSEKTTKPPEIGSIRHCLHTAAHSEKRAVSSQLLKELRRLVSAWPRSKWLLSDTGLLGKLDVLASKYRNPAAHTEELGAEDYLACKELVAGPSGLLWELVIATSS